MTEPQRRFLMVAYFFPPMGDGGVFRSLKLARYLPEHGWTPSVLCGRPEDYWVRDESLLDELPADLSVQRVGGLTGQSLLRRLRRGGGPGPGAAAGQTGARSSGLFRQLRRLGELLLMPDSYAGWIGPARRRGRRLLRAAAAPAAGTGSAGPIELIYSSGPPDSAHLVAAALARESGLPWVADFRDPWFNLHLKTPPSALHRWLHRRLEGRVLDSAQVVAVTEGWRRRYAERCPRPPLLIRNGYDPADFADLPPRPDRGQANDSVPTIDILHTGKLSLTRSARPFLAGLAALFAAEPDLRGRLRLSFIGPRESDNEAAVGEMGLGDCVRFEDPVSHAESVARQARADLLLLIKHDDPRYRDLIPGKFYEYVAAGAPILAVTPAGEITTLMEQHDLGWTCRPEAASVHEGLALACRALTDPALARPRREPVEAFTRPAQAAAMAALFDSLVGSDHARGAGERSARTGEAP